ncbi:hypothetical protein HY031_00865 [Candidatus Gottesmanbacteria bacterium]|nr:hypothetical protein [Candidatus Gottesmanbacteria bacterium]
MSVRFFANKWVRIAAILVILVAASVPSVYFYTKYQKARQQLANPAELSREQTNQLIGAVGKLMELPSDEQPTIATVTDAEKLRTQAFFTNAQNGDRVLIYTTAKKAILFRPSINKIIEVAPVNIGQSASASAQAATPTLRPTLTPTTTPKAR